MNQKEIANTHALVGGTAAWKNAGYPMESSAVTPSPVTAPPVAEQPIAEQNKANTNSLKK